MPKVIGISGSERLGGNTEQFLQRALDIIASYGIETELVTLADKKINRGCKGCLWCRQNRAECSIKDDFMSIWRKIHAADGIILGSPVYWGTATAKMKAVLERAGTLSEGREIDNLDGPVADLEWPQKPMGPGLYHRKIGGAVAVTRRTGANFTLAELVMWLIHNNFIVVGSSYWTVGIGTRRTGQAGATGKSMKEPSRDMITTDIEGAHAIEHFAHNFAWLVKQIRNQQI